MDGGLQIPKDWRQGIHLFIISVVVVIVGFLISLSGLTRLGRIVMASVIISGFTGFFWQLGATFDLKRKKQPSPQMHILGLNQNYAFNQAAKHSGLEYS